MKKEIIKFERGSILTKNMLESLYSYPKDLIDINYMDYSNGIIKGLSIVKKEDSFLLQKGILKYKNEIFVLNKDLNLEKYLKDLKDGFRYVIYFEYVGINTVEKGIDEKVFDLKISKLSEYEKLEVEKEVLFLGKFTYCSKNKINFAISLESFIKSKNDCFNNIRCKYSGYRKYTLSHDIGYLILTYLKKKENPHPLDFTIISQLTKEGTIDYDLISYYINIITNENIEGYSNEEIFEVFCQSLNKPYELYINSIDTVKDEDKNNKATIRGGLID